MPYAAGTFSLVAGNPVVTGTIVSSTWANNTLSDIATGLTTCILKDGTQTTTVSIPFAVGLSVPAGNSITGAGNLAITGTAQWGTGTANFGKVAKRMTADVTTIATAFSTVTALSFSIAANEEWQAEYPMNFFTGSAFSGLRIAVVTPTGATQNISNASMIASATVAPFATATLSSSGAMNVLLAGVAGGEIISNTSLWVLNGANAGTVDFQISVVTATAAATGLVAKKGSHMYATRLV